MSFARSVETQRSSHRRAPSTGLLTLPFAEGFGVDLQVATMVRFYVFGVVLFIIFSASSMGQTTSSGSYQDYFSSIETCSSNNENITLLVDDTASATTLAEAVNCSGGSFKATWRGSVSVEHTIIIPEGTTLNVTGEGSGAEINGGGKTRLFKAEGATLHMTNLTLKNGNATYGGALYVNGSTVSWNGVASFVSNTASDNGGALYAYDSNVSWYGVTIFDENTADYGGALYISESTVSWNGVTTFVNNTADYGGALYAYDSNVSWDGVTTFDENTADYRGALYAHGSTVSWHGVTSFVNNTADYGGALYAYGSNISWDGVASFVNNTADYGGALYASESNVSWDGVTSFVNNTAEYGGALYAYDSNISWYGVTTFDENTADYGGALYASESTVSWDGVTTFDENTAGYGGALYASESTVSWNGETAFLNNTADSYGGALRGFLYSDISWDGVTSFLDNRAQYGGALAVYKSSINVMWSGMTSFDANIAMSSGGAIYVIDSSDISIQGDTNFTDNEADIDGGAVYVFVDCDDTTSSNFILGNNSTVLFQDNTCGGDGGAIALIGEVYTSLSISMTFKENTAGVAGGAIYISDVTAGIQFEGTRFISNTAVIGGGLYSMGSGTAGTEGGGATSDQNPTTLIGCEFIGNKAKRTGGAMDSSGGTDTIVSTYFAQNTAIIGGALSLVGTSNLTNCTFVENSAYEDEGPAISNDGDITHFSNCSFVNNVFNCEEGNYLEFDDTFAQLDDSCTGCSTNCTSCIFEGKRPTECVETLEHTSAAGVDSTLQSLLIDPGYWRATNTSVNILECFNSKACLGGETGDCKYCLEGYEGPYCSVCSKNYTSSFGFTCNKCSDNTAGGIALAAILAFVVLFVFVALVLHLISGRMGRADQGIVTRVARFVPLHSIKIVIVVWQIITQFATVANVVFPDVYQKFLDGVDILNFDLNWVLSTGCIIDTDFHDQLLLATMGPLACIIILGSTYIAAMRRNLVSKEARGIVRQKHVSMVLLLTFLIYSSVSSTLFKTFACDELDDGKIYLRADYRIECTSSKHNALEIYAGFMVIMYVIGIPVFYGVLLYYNREVLAKNKGREEAESIKPITDLWKPYRPDRFYYEVVECFRRVLLTGALVYIYPNTAAQIAVAIMLATFFMIVSEALAPHSSLWDTWISRTGHAIVFTSMFLALLLKVDVTVEYASSQKTFESVLVAAHSCLVLVVVIQAVVMVMALRKEVKEYPEPRMRLGYSRSVGKGGIFLEDEAPPSYVDEVKNVEKSHPSQVMGQSQTATNKEIDISWREGEGQC